MLAVSYAPQSSAQTQAQSTNRCIHSSSLIHTCTLLPNNYVNVSMSIQVYLGENSGVTLKSLNTLSISVRLETRSKLDVDNLPIMQVLQEG